MYCYIKSLLEETKQFSCGWICWVLQLIFVAVKASRHLYYFIYFHKYREKFLLNLTSLKLAPRGEYFTRTYLTLIVSALRSGSWSRRFSNCGTQGNKVFFPPFTVKCRCSLGRKWESAFYFLSSYVFAWPFFTLIYLGRTWGEWGEWGGGKCRDINEVQGFSDLFYFVTSVVNLVVILICPPLLYSLRCRLVLICKILQRYPVLLVLVL